MVVYQNKPSRFNKAGLLYNCCMSVQGCMVEQGWTILQMVLCQYKASSLNKDELFYNGDMSVQGL